MKSKLAFPSLLVHGFRGFGELAIPKLGRLNLIVGKNNVGKSSLLEALRLYAYDGDTPVIEEILDFRGEIALDFETSVRRTESDEIPAVLYLFHGFPLISDKIAPIAVGPMNNESETVSLSIQWFVEEKSSDGIARLVEKTPQLLEVGETIPALSVKFGSVRKSVTRLEYFSHRERSNRGVAFPPEYRMSCVYVDARGLRRSFLRMMWNKVALTEKETEVIEGLKIIVPDIERVALLGSKDYWRNRAMVKTSRVLRPIPLSSLGEGVNRVFDIVLALVNAKGGLLLIDEIENGLHYSAQPAVWKLLFRLARQLDVQVFATSHSWDSIEAFQKAAQEDQGEEGVLISLRRTNGDIRATIFDEKELSIVTKDRIEVR